MTDILLEKKLTTDFTMGFELEAVWLTNTDDEDEDDEYGDRRSENYENYEDEINYLFDTEFPGGDLHGDGSVHGYGEGAGFEWSSPVLPFNVASIQKIINFYRNHLGSDFIVNDSCGYHHHISFAGITLEDMVWIMCKLALDTKMRNLISNFEGISFVSGWSGDEYLDDLADAVKNNNYSRIVDICNTDKYSLVNVHRNKTLEWRVPRGFLNKGNTDIIIKFYKRLFKFVSWITDVLDENEIEGISKDNFLDMIRAALPNDKRIGNFTSGKKTSIKGEMNPETVNKFIDQIIEDQHNIFKLINQPRPFEQVIQRLYNRNRLGGVVKILNNDENKNDGNIFLLNNLAYKYIPYRMAIDYFDTLSKETLDKTSALTMERFMKTAVKDGFKVTNPMKYEVLGKILSEADARIISPDNAKSLYSNDNTDWNGSFNILLIIYKNNWIKDIENRQLAYNNALENVLESDNLSGAEELVNMFVVPSLVDDIKAKSIAPILANNIEKYKEVIQKNGYCVEDILAYAKEKGLVDKVLAQLYNFGLINKEQETEYMAKLTSQSIDNINRLRNGEEE